MHRAGPLYACVLASAITLVSAAGACGSKEPTAQPLPALSTITKAGGDMQTGAAGAPLPVQLSVLVKDSSGRGLAGVAVRWTVTAGGGTVGGSGSTDVSGLAAATWTLGIAAGPNSATASVAGLAPVTFTATATGGGGGPAVLLQENFDDANLASRGWYDLPTGGIASIDTSQHVAGSVASLKINFSQGGVEPSPSTAARHAITASDSVYVRYWVKHSANWVGSGQTFHPHLFSLLTNADGAYVGPGHTHLTVYIEENYQSGDFAVLGAQDGSNIDTSRVNQDLTHVTENRAVSGCNGNPDGTADISCYLSGGAWQNGKMWWSAQAVLLPGQGPTYQGDWHEVEAFFRLNSIQNGVAQPDGVAQYWVDGQLVIDLHGVALRTGAHPTMQFNQFFMGPYIGSGSPVAQQLWIDNLVVMTARP